MRANSRPRVDLPPPFAPNTIMPCGLFAIEVAPLIIDSRTLLFFLSEGVFFHGVLHLGVANMGVDLGAT